MPVKKSTKNYVDVKTKRRIREHISNENDHISDEDIRNARTDFPAEERIGSSYQVEEEKQPEDEKFENKKIDNNKVPGIETPWNLLSK